MLDRDLLRNDPERVREAAASKNEPCPIDEWLGLDAKRRALVFEIDELRKRRNELSKEVSLAKRQGLDASSSMAESREIGERIALREKETSALDAALSGLELRFPNMPDPDVPRGDASANIVVRQFGEKQAFDFEPRPHWELLRGGLDPEAAGRIAGSNFILLRGPAAALQRRLISWMIDTHAKSGMLEVWAPFLARSESMTTTAQLPKLEADMYRLEHDDLYLVPTGEVPITNLFREAILDEAELPVKLCGYTPCFRREAGSYGRETRGLNRVHQFEKVEMVWLTHPERSAEAHLEMLAQAEALLQQLGLTYRVVLLAAGDLSFAASKCYDIELWAPGQNAWLEVSSVSNFRDFQARRGMIRFRPSDGGKPRLVHTLNGSGLALPRLIAAIAEQFQTPGIPDYPAFLLSRITELTLR